MKKEIMCEECLRSKYTETICDTCGNLITSYGYKICSLGEIRNIILSIEETSYDFCSYQCLLKFIVEELKKNQPKENENEITS